jgi:hypothetical protein
MGYKKGNKHGAKKMIAQPLDFSPICFKGFLGQKEELKLVDGWQDKFREYAAYLIQASKENS